LSEKVSLRLTFPYRPEVAMEARYAYFLEKSLQREGTESKKDLKQALHYTLKPKEPEAK
jgi:hypothetical protein